MAARFSLCSSLMTTPSMGSSRLRVRCLKNGKLVMMCSKNHASFDVQTRSSHKNKIFEDQSAGIVCYRDENGEITCEGYDEGPRFHQKLSRFNYKNNTRDVEIIGLLERCWFQVADESRDEGET